MILAANRFSIYQRIISFDEGTFANNIVFSKDFPSRHNSKYAHTHTWFSNNLENKGDRSRGLDNTSTTDVIDDSLRVATETQNGN